MRRSVIVCGVGAVMMLGNSAWGAPRRAGGQGKGRTPAAKVKAPISQIAILDVAGGDSRVGSDGATLTLHSNGTATRKGFAKVSPGEIGSSINEIAWQGTFNAWDFAHLAAYVESSRLLDLKVPPERNDNPFESDGFLSISTVRGGKKKEITIFSSAPDSPATQAGWVTLNLVRSITADIRWKNSKGLAVDTGLRVSFSTRDGSSPAFGVYDAKGKGMGRVSAHDESQSDTLLLPPGTYRLAEIGKVQPNSPPEMAQSGWRVAPAQFEVTDGSFTYAAVTAEETPAAP